MNHKRAAIATAAGVAVIGLLAPTPVGAEEAGDDTALTIDPTSGPIGTTIEVTGTGCYSEDIEFVLIKGTSLDESFGLVDLGLASAAEDGRWNGTLYVHDQIELFGDGGSGFVDTTPGTDYLVAAVCHVAAPSDAGDEPEVLARSLGDGEAGLAQKGDEPPVADGPVPVDFMYDPVPFEVTGDTGTPPATEPTPPTTEPAPPTAVPAQAVKAMPAYTG